jgi:hypothetical protein
VRTIDSVSEIERRRAEIVSICEAGWIEDQARQQCESGKREGKPECPGSLSILMIRFSLR